MNLTNPKAVSIEEVLYACPGCHRTGFTARGLTAHRCDRGVKPKQDAAALFLPSPPKKRLTPAEIAEALKYPQRQSLLFTIGPAAAAAADGMR